MKIRCRILDNLNANGALHEAGTKPELDLTVADIEMLIERRVIEPLDQDNDDDVMLIGSSVQPSEFILHGRRITLGQVVGAAKRRSGLPAEAWNELPDDEREALIEDERIRLGAELVVFAEQESAGASASADDESDTSSGGQADAAVDVVLGTKNNVRESGTRQGTGAEASLPAAASSAGGTAAVERKSAAAPAAAAESNTSSGDQAPAAAGDSVPAAVTAATTAGGTATIPADSAGTVEAKVKSKAKAK